MVSSRDPGGLGGKIRQSTGDSKKPKRGGFGRVYEGSGAERRG